MGNEHLKGADEKASSNIANKCMIFLVTAILILAVILGFKYSSSK